MTSRKNNVLGFKKEAIYRIVVDGFIDESWSDQFGGMQILVEKKKGARTVSILIGEIKDQSALSGILNNLYDMQFTVISVNMLFEKN